MLRCTFFACLVWKSSVGIKVLFSLQGLYEKFVAAINLSSVRRMMSVKFVGL